MSTYYELLGISPNASQDEVESAINTQYNKWRRLVNHHDPEIALQANQSLHTLEKIRQVLLSKDERRKYDAELGVVPQGVSGLIDPDAISHQNPQTIMPISHIFPRSEVGSNRRVDAWVCQYCDSPNPIGTQFCSKCGKKIGELCPKCHELMALMDDYCSNCGINKEEHFRLIIQPQNISTLQSKVNSAKNKVMQLNRILGRLIITKSMLEKEGLSPEPTGCWPDPIMGVWSTILLFGIFFRNFSLDKDISYWWWLVNWVCMMIIRGVYLNRLNKGTIIKEKNRLQSDINALEMKERQIRAERYE